MINYSITKSVVCVTCMANTPLREYNSSVAGSDFDIFSKFSGNSGKR